MCENFIEKVKKKLEKPPQDNGGEAIPSTSTRNSGKSRCRYHATNASMAIKIVNRML